MSTSAFAPVTSAHRVHYPVNSPGHFVQFYETDGFLIESVAGFIADALEHARPAIVIATLEHRAQLAVHLHRRGHVVSEQVACGSLVLLDAREVLAQFMRGGRPDAVLFRLAVDRIVQRAASRGRFAAFGEMVSLLVADGLTEAAVELEHLWNRLHCEFDFVLFCAYPMAAFAADATSSAFGHICAAHQHVIPAETYLACSDAGSRMRVVANLQQQAMVLHRERVERHNVERSIQALRRLDPATGLINRATFRDVLQTSIAIAQREGDSIALLHVDIDRFQRLNDILGQAGADQLLGVLAQRLKNSVRDDDVVARLTGDEFAVLLTGSVLGEDVEALAARIRGSFSRPVTIAGHNLVVTASIGISSAPCDAEDADRLLTAADLALREAKSRGGDCCNHFAVELQQELRASLTLEERMRDALSRDEFRLVYQPVYCLRSNAIVAVEALLRWQPPDGPAIPPATFIPIAEQSGLIVPLGNWVIRSACSQGRLWRDAGFLDLKVLVNLSAMQLAQPDLIERVTAITHHSGFPPQGLVFEITESVFLEEAEVTSARLASLRSLGAQISLDDFGTGYSCLSYLKHLPLDKLKIDRSFIKELDSNSTDAAIVSVILSMGRALHLDVVAEGVERPEQLAALQALECPSVQGYLLSPPVEAACITRLLHPVFPDPSRQIFRSL